MRAQNNQSGGGGNIKVMPGSGRKIDPRAKVTQSTSTNDKGQKVTTTTSKLSLSGQEATDAKKKFLARRNARLQNQSGGTTNSGGSNKGVPTKDTKFATDKLLNKNRTDGKTYSAADAKRMEKSFNQRLQSEPDFDEFDDVPVVNSKGKKVKKIPGTNPISGGTKKQSDSVNQNISSF